MRSRRLRIPASLTVSLLGLGGVSCGPSTETPDAAVTLNCDSVCRANQSVYLQNCIPVPNDAGPVMCTAAQDASATFCAVASVARTANGACCCEPVA